MDISIIGNGLIEDLTAISVAANEITPLADQAIALISTLI